MNTGSQTPCVAIIDLQSLEREVYRLRSNGSNKNAKLNAIKTAEANYLQAEAEVLSLEREVAHLINSTKYATIAITIQQLPSDL
jgi:phage host-nuclease inhibitor protein Gam